MSYGHQTSESVLFIAEMHLNNTKEERPMVDSSDWFRFSTIIGIFVSLLSLTAIITPATTYAQDAPENLGPSGLPLPRFVSIKPARVNVRVGPGRNYTIVFSYQKQGLPVEITQEYDQWRKIRDSDGDEGWVYQSLLSGRRTAMITPWQKNKSKLAPLRRQPSENAALAAELEPGVLSTIHQCDGTWCELDIGHTRGWITQDQLWGAYPGEKIKN